MFTARALFFVLLLALAATLHAEVIIPVSGSGDFFCGFYPSNTGYAAQVDASFSGQDSQGNPISGGVVNAFTKNAGPCSASVPEIDVAGGGSDAAGFTGDVDYLGIDYSITFSKGCEELIASSQQFIGGCSPVFDVEQNGRLALTLTTYNGSVLQLEGPTEITSGDVSLQAVHFVGGAIVNFYFSNGTFDIGAAPEPATWLLMICAAPLLLGRMKKETRSKRI